MTSRPRIAFLFDVDNTLLDNDRFETDLRDWLTETIGPGGADTYWQALENRRGRLGYVDYLGAVQDCRDSETRQGAADPRWFGLGEFLLGYPFAERVYPGVPELLATLGRAGPVWLVSDGDAVMQPHKLRRSGLWDAVSGVRILIHKESQLDAVARACPADHHVLIDDKPRILQAVRRLWQDRVTTILPRQGHYARAFLPGDDSTGNPAGGFTGGDAPDIVIDSIGGLAENARLRNLVAALAPEKEDP